MTIVIFAIIIGIAASWLHALISNTYCMKNPMQSAALAIKIRLEECRRKLLIRKTLAKNEFNCKAAK